MSDLYELPNGWEWSNIDSIIDNKDDFTDGNWVLAKDYDLPKEVRLLQLADIGDGYFVDKSNKWVSENKSIELKGKYLNNGDILISRLGEPLGKSCIVPKLDYKTMTAVDVAILRENDNNFFNRYVMLYFNCNTAKDFINKEATGATRKRISRKNLGKVPLPLPSLKEQQRIVSKLDKLFEKINKSIALHQKNMDEADVFMGSVLNNVFGELEEKYETDNIGNMIDVLTDYHSNGSYKILKENVELLDEENYSLMIRATDLENEDYENNVKYISESAYNFLSKTKVYGGEIILPKIGTIGNVYFMPYLERPTSLAMNLFMLRCSNNVDNKYLFSYLKSPKGNEDILSRANGATTKTITKDSVRSIELPFPPLNIQHKVVKYLDDISKKIEKVKSVQKEKMDNLKALKASILDKAFRGEL